MANKVQLRAKGDCSYSLLFNLRKDGLITPQIESFVTQIPMEDLIAVKLELGLRKFGYPVINRKLWKILPNIVVSAYLKYALSSCDNFKQLIKYFGLSYADVANYLRSGEFFRYISKEERDKLELLKKIVGIMRKGDHLPTILAEEELLYRQGHSGEFLETMENNDNEEDFNGSSGTV